MVMDQEGRGQFIMHSFIESNSDWHLELVLQDFKAAHETWGNINVVMVDKDLREINVVRNEIPQARPLLCHFHVIKYLGGVVQAGKHGTFSAAEKATIQHIVHNMTYADSLAAYNQQKEDLKNVCSRADGVAFWDYFSANWDSCSDPIVDDVRLMLRAGGRPGRIYEYLRQNSGRPVVMKDVHNLISKLRRGKEQLSDDALVADELLTVVLEDEKNVVAVHENEAGYSGVISIATSRMRSLFARYPELVLLDCTHKTNR